MKKAFIFFVLLFILVRTNVVHGVQIYFKSFDSMDGLTTVNGAEGGNVSTESGPLKLEEVYHNYREPYVSIERSQLVSPYRGVLSDLAKIIWAFNLSYMDAPEGDANTMFEVHIVLGGAKPNAGNLYSYELMGGGGVGHRMAFTRNTHAKAPYGNTHTDLIDITCGLSPLPQKGTFRIEFVPSSGRWDLYAEFGDTYADPMSITNLVGIANDISYTDDYMTYFTMEGTNGGDVFIDNYRIEAFSKKTVDIDINPASSSNIISLQGYFSTPFATLTTDDFEAASVDPSLVNFGPNQDLPLYNSEFKIDVNQEDVLDVLVFFQTDETGIPCEDTEVRLTGETLDGLFSEEKDYINTIMCDEME